MAEVGEQIVGAYLKVIENCDLVEYNIPLRDAKGQGEIDVVGINLKDKVVYLCEVATHILGLQYVKNRRPDTYNKVKSKLEKDIAYGRKYFSGFELRFMFWSPIVAVAGEKALYQPVQDFERLGAHFRKQQIEVTFVYNEEYLRRFNEIKEFAAGSSAHSPDLPIRFLQIQAKLEKHCAKLAKRK